MADLVAVMHEGELQQLAPPAEIYDRPANRFVATFVGNPPMNVLRAAVDRQACTSAAQIPLEPSRRDGCIAAEVAEIGTRPEDLGIVEAGTPGALPGEVYVVEPMGNETLVDLRIGDEHLSLRDGSRIFRADRRRSSAYGSTLRSMLLRAGRAHGGAPAVEYGR